MTDETRNVRIRNRLLMPRSRGSMLGLGLALLGLWGALIPFVGPYFDYAYTPDTTWTWTASRFFLQVLPGAVTFFAGLVLLGSANRANAAVAGWLAVLSGVWFVVGSLLSPIWNANYVGTPVGDTVDVSVERIGIFYGLGAAIILLAALAIGRFSVIGLGDVASARRYESYPTGATSSAPPTTQTVGAAQAESDRADLDYEGGRRVHGRRAARHG